MSRYIDVEKIEFPVFESKADETWVNVAINATPTADVRENVHGEWLYTQLIPNTIEGNMHGECSVCHKVRIVDNFCPNCGADMRTKDEV